MTALSVASAMGGTNNGSLTTSTTNTTVAPGTIGVAATLTVLNAASLGDGTILALDLSSATTPGGCTNDLLKVGGNLTITVSLHEEKK